jgi:hypothetical protein
VNVSENFWRTGAKEQFMRIGIKTVLGLLCAIAVLAALPSRSTAQSATDYAGTFNGDRMSAEIVAAGDGTYTGTLHLGSNQFPLKAHIENGQLVGTFSSAGKEFPFHAASTPS